jgi:hypothetical protein
MGAPERRLRGLQSTFPSPPQIIQIAAPKVPPETRGRGLRLCEPFYLIRREMLAELVHRNLKKLAPTNFRFWVWRSAESCM